MARYLQTPITPIVDMGYKPPIDWWNAEIERKNKMAEQGQADLDAIGATTFQNLPEDQAWADELRADIKSNEEKLATMYSEDPIKAGIAIKKYTRQLKRDLETPGSPIYDIQNQYLIDQKRREEVEKIQKENPELNWFSNYELARQQYKGLQKDQNGKITGHLNFSGLRNVPNIPEKVDESLAEIKATLEETYPGYKWIDEISKWRALTQTTKGVQSSAMQKTLEGMLMTDENIKWGTGQYVLKRLTDKANKKNESGEYLYQGNTLNERLESLESEYQEQTKDIKAHTIANLNAELSKTTDPTVRQELLEEIKNVENTSAADEIQQDFLQGLLETGFSKYGAQEKTINHQYFDDADKKKQKLDGLSNLGTVTAGNFSNNYQSLEALSTKAEQSKQDLEGYKQSIKNIGYQQAMSLGLFDDKVIVPGTSIEVPTASEDMQNVMLMNVPAMVAYLNSNDPDKKTQIETHITNIRTSIGIQEPFKFSSDDEFIEFSNQQVQVFNHMKELTRLQEQQELLQDTKKNLALAILDKNKLVQEGLDYKNTKITVSSTVQSGGKEGIGKTTVTKTIPNSEIIQKIWENFFNINEENYLDFLTTHAGKSMEELKQLNKEFAETLGASDLSTVKSKDVDNAVSALYYRLQQTQNVIDKELKKNPELLNNISNVKIFIPKEADHELTDLTGLIQTTFDKKGLLRTLQTPDGNSFEQAVQQQIDDDNWTVEKIKDNSLNASIISNPIGEYPMLQFSFTSIDDKSKPIVNVAITEENQKAVFDLIHEFGNKLSMASIENKSQDEIDQADTFIGHLNFAPIIYKSFIAANATSKTVETNPVPVAEINGHIIEVSKNKFGNFEIYADGQKVYGANYEISDKPKSFENLYLQLGKLYRKLNASN